MVGHMFAVVRSVHIPVENQFHTRQRQEMFDIVGTGKHNSLLFNSSVKKPAAANVSKPAILHQVFIQPIDEIIVVHIFKGN
jgi:hypothetical protein